ncbi:subclass B1 metallo-beta-lactamase [Chitinophaga sp. G-6-1-13]|uniref:beta-lactamase n=1 Tax=Chitinophaga fulva TaxID=2728842 RepID=A0A848GR26_9BACT|nr:subclass B1 metallo-beta-lactamase [Chitinophaga fulva]NML39502.1 subclass B1 metallo-beta-lactamase [Chitinophaga fulva]
MKRLKYISGIALIAALLPSLTKAQTKDEPLKISHLAGNCYVYTTKGTLDDGSRFPSNSMYVITREGAVMIDIPWDTTQLGPLLNAIRQRHGKKVIACIATHFHDDRTAGLNALAAKGIKTYSTAQTLALCKKEHNDQAQYIIPEDTTFRFGDRRVEVFFPGAGHSPDNIVIWVPEDKVLYGGCFVKSTDSRDLGNLSDAKPYEWKNAMLRLKARYPHPAVTVPGHGALDNRRSACDYTIDLIKAYEEKHPQ